MRKVRVNRVMLAVFLGLTTPIIVGVGYVWLGMKNSGGLGSMDEALKLMPTVDAMPEPERLFCNRGTGQFGVRFKNGEWVTGVAKDSHGLYSDWYGGGTVVMKDSRGRVRCFFGHVCGGLGALEGAAEFDSLDMFDAKLAEQKFAEHPWP
jgi:hypothetical protein